MLGGKKKWFGFVLVCFSLGEEKNKIIIKIPNSILKSVLTYTNSVLKSQKKNMQQSMVSLSA